MHPATVKQIEFAKAIAERLNRQLPFVETKEAYNEFISTNIVEFHQKKVKHTGGKATKRQIMFVKQIASRLSIDPPGENTKEAYSVFITEHIEDFKKECKKKRTRKYNICRGMCPGHSGEFSDTVPEEFRHDIEKSEEHALDPSTANMTDFVYDDLLLPKD